MNSMLGAAKLTGMDNVGNEEDTSMLLPHNIRVYKDLMQLLKSYKTVCLETCTGSGKSYVAGQIIKNTKWRTCIVVPTRIIKYQWEELFEKYNIDANIITYTKFGQLNIEEIAISNYDFYILDEVHHIGAEVWGKNFDYIQSLNINILGLSADTIRWSSNAQDVGVEKFEYKYIGYELADAISNGIVNSFEYITTLYNNGDEYLDIDNDYIPEDNIDAFNKLNGKLQYSIKNIESIHNILCKHLEDSNKKIIVFVEDLSAVDDTIERLSFLVNSRDNIREISINSTNYREIMDWFKDSIERVILVAVNVLNEGVHVESADTVIMLRKTNSPNVFFQQLGRVISSNKDRDYVKVFDFVSNAYNLRFWEGSRIIERFIDVLNSRILKVSNQIIVHDYSADIVSILNEIDELRTLYVRWNDEEIDILKKYYPAEGPDVYKRLNRTRNTVLSKAISLGLEYVGFSEEEDEIIKRYWNRRDKYEIYDKLIHNPTHDRIVRRARKLGLDVVKNLDYYTEEEDEIIKNTELSITDVVDVLNNLEFNKSRNIVRTYSGVSHRRRSFGLIKNEIWSEEDIAILKEYYPLMGANCKKFLSVERTANSVTSFAVKLGIDRLKKSEVILKFFKIYGWDFNKYRDIVGSSDSDMITYLNKMGYYRDDQNRKWSDEDTEKLKRLYKKYGKKWVNYTKHFTNRSSDTIRGKINRLIENKEIEE